MSELNKPSPRPTFLLNGLTSWAHDTAILGDHIRFCKGIRVEEKLNKFVHNMPVVFLGIVRSLRDLNLTPSAKMRSLLLLCTVKIIFTLKTNFIKSVGRIVVSRGRLINEWKYDQRFINSFIMRCFILYTSKVRWVTTYKEDMQKVELKRKKLRQEGLWIVGLRNVVLLKKFKWLIFRTGRRRYLILSAWLLMNWPSGTWPKNLILTLFYWQP